MNALKHVADDAEETISEETTRTALLSLGRDGVIRVMGLAGTAQTVEDAKTNMDVVARFSAGTPCGVLIDLSRGSSLSSEAQSYYAGDHRKSVSAVAVLTNSLVGRVFGNLFMTFFQPKAEVRLFGTRAEAIPWLRARSKPRTP